MEDCIEMDEAVQSTPAWRFRMLHVAHRAALDTLLERHGLKECGHPFILFLLMRGGEDGCMSMQKELSKCLRVSPATVTSALKLLEKQGCIGSCWKSRAASNARPRSGTCAKSGYA